MANTDHFTPEEVTQILEAFFETVGTRQYIGARYVPIFGRKGEESIVWDNSKPYEPLTIVLYQGNSFTSRQYVPEGVDITNQEFWAETGNYNAQIEQYRQEVHAVREDMTELQEELDKKSVEFSSVSDMQQNVTLQVGSYYSTSGFYSSGDGGAATYQIVENATPNNMDVIECANNLYAVLKSGINNPACYGADSTGVRDSTSQVNYCITKNHNKNIVFPNGTYLFNGTIGFDYMLDAGTCIDFNGSTIICNASNYGIGVGTINFQSNAPSGGAFNKDRRICAITNFHMVSESTYGVYIERNFLNVHLTHFEIETTKNGICIGGIHSNLDARATDAYIHDFVITNKDMRNDFIGIYITNTDNKISDGRIYGFKTGMRGVIGFVDQVHFLATNIPTDGSFKMTNDWCCIRCETFAPTITNCYCDSIPCFFKPTSRCDSFIVKNLYIYSYNKNIMSEASIFDLTELATVQTPIINITDCFFMIGTYPTNAKFIELPSLPETTDGSSSFLKDAVIQGINITNPAYNTTIIKEIWRKQVTIPFRNRWFASAVATAGNWVPLGTIVAPRSEDLIFELQAYNSTYACRVRIAKENGAIRVSQAENMGATPYSTNLEYKICTNNDGYVDVYYRVHNANTPSYYTVTKLLSTWAIMLPAYTADYAQAMPSYTDSELSSKYISITDVNINA